MRLEIWRVILITSNGENFTTRYAYYTQVILYGESKYDHVSIPLRDYTSELLDFQPNSNHAYLNLGIL